MIPARQLVTVGLLTLALLGLSELFARQQEYSRLVEIESTRMVTPSTTPAPRFPDSGPPGEHRLNDFRVINTLGITYILLLPALCIFAYRKEGEPMEYWFAFWTFAFLVYFTRLCLDNHSWKDMALTALWGFDVAAAWAVLAAKKDVWKTPKWIRAERGVVHLWLYAALTWFWLTTAEHWYIKGLGFALTTTGAVALLARVVIKPFDSNSFSGRLYVGLFNVINPFTPWHRLPTWLGILNLGAYRETLRATNLYDTKDIPVTNPGNVAEVPKYDPTFLYRRDDGGYYNDLGCPAMGAASTNTEPVALSGSGAQATRGSMYFNRSQPGARFGRNVPLDKAHQDEQNLLNPNPRLISNELLARDTFKPARILNLLAAAWIQFETHDWFNHGEPPFAGEKEKNPGCPFSSQQIEPHRVELPPGDRWHDSPMRVRPTRPDPTRDYDKESRDTNGRLRFPKTYVNTESHWWDGSQVYGSNPQTTLRLRSEYTRDDAGNLLPTGKLLKDGKLFIGTDGVSLDPSTGIALAGFTGNWWVGLSLLHTLFTREHNAICDAIRREYSYWPDDQVFDTARLVNAALIAKIHTIEWTPAILAHPAIQVGMAANWWGLLTERVKKLFGRISQNEAFSGIPGSGVDHGVADYCLTEEFVSVYRLHPLMPDTLEVRSARDGQLLKEYVLPDGVIGDRSLLTALGAGATMDDLFYSFGVTYPGAVTLHNYPNFLRKLTRPEAFGVSEVVDLASIDILRDRERGVPRYNEFRRQLHCKPIASFDDFANPSFPTLALDLRRVYGTTDGKDNVELLDTMVGMFAEVPPAGFGVSDTAFRIFILMASRRLKSDRFIAGEAFIPEVYTQVGLDWLENTSMRDILLRHYPELKPSLYGVTNAFAPWRTVEVNLAAAGGGASAQSRSGLP